jgi:transcriptional repressor NrdR
LRCGRRFTTYERIEFVPVVVLKKSGERESFDRSKLLRGIVTACEKTGITHAALESIVDEIEAELQQRSTREIASNEIGELVLKHLQNLNEVAYIRFASVHRQFRGIRDFVETLNHLQSSTEPELTRSESQLDRAAASPDQASREAMNASEHETTNQAEETGTPSMSHS